MTVASAARTVSGDSGILTGWGVADALRCQLNVTAAAGASPTLDVVVEDTLDGSNWNPIATFAQRVGPGREVLNVAAPFTDRLRVRWTIGGMGAPSFTFGVDIYGSVSVGEDHYSGRTGFLTRQPPARARRK